MGPENVVSGGGAAGLALAIAYIIMQVIKSRAEKTGRQSGAITDASTANAILTNSLQDERTENSALRQRLTNAERRIEDLQHALDTERTTHRQELRALHQQLDELAKRLAAAEARYAKDGP